jgi:hypothetical protein
VTFSAGMTVRAYRPLCLKTEEIALAAYGWAVYRLKIRVE